MRKAVFLISLMFTNVSAFGQTAVNVKCMTEGDNSRTTFEGDLVVSNVIDLPTGGFTVIGRRILKDQVQRVEQLPTCRDWYIESQSWIDADERFFYTYQRRVRSWNVIQIDQQSATIRMSCATGSVLTEYDSLQTYIEEYSQRVVEQNPPRAGSRDNTRDYISGRTTVSADDCVVSHL